MSGGLDYLLLDDEALLAQCEAGTYKASGPGGQHRNKVTSAVRLTHRPTGLTAQGTESRSQHENRRHALKRIRMRIACEVRASADLHAPPPAAVAECLHRGRGGPRRLIVSVRNPRFWTVAAYALDLLETCEGRLGEAAAALGVTTSNLAGFLKTDRHLLTAAQGLRAAHGHGPIR